jgi:hypothetical protein
VKGKGPRFWIGVGFIAASFALYPAFAVIAFLPITAASKIACAFAAWALSWGLFALGGLLAGKEGIRYVREALFRQRSLTPPRI